MDREPLPPPFPVGTRLRYVGTRVAGFRAADGTTVPYEAPGLVVEVTNAPQGRRGTLRPLPMEDGDDEPYFDTTRDGYSTYDVVVDGKPYGRIIWPTDAHEWEQV